MVYRTVGALEHVHQGDAKESGVVIQGSNFRWKEHKLRCRKQGVGVGFGVDLGGVEGTGSPAFGDGGRNTNR